jgi:hypothetical protein
MEISIGRPIRDGRHAQRMAGSPSRIDRQERNDRRPIKLNGSMAVKGTEPVLNSSTAVIRRENGAINAPKAITVPGRVIVRGLWGVPVEGAEAAVAVNFKL